MHKKAVREAAAADQQASHGESAKHAKRPRCDTITASGAAAASSSSSTAVRDSAAAEHIAKGTAQFEVSLSDEEPSESPVTQKDHFAEERSWENVYTIMMQFETVTGRAPGAIKCFGAMKLPTLCLHQACDRHSRQTEP